MRASWFCSGPVVIPLNPLETRLPSTFRPCTTPSRCQKKPNNARKHYPYRADRSGQGRWYIPFAFASQRCLLALQYGARDASIRSIAKPPRT